MIPSSRTFLLVLRFRVWVWRIQKRGEVRWKWLKGVEREFLKDGGWPCYSRCSIRRGKKVSGTPEETGRQSTWKYPL